MLFSPRLRSMERSQTELKSETSQQKARTVEEQRRREAQDSLVRRLQKRVLLLTKVHTLNQKTLRLKLCRQKFHTIKENKRLFLSIKCIIITGYNKIRLSKCFLVKT